MQKWVIKYVCNVPWPQQILLKKTSLFKLNDVNKFQTFNLMSSKMIGFDVDHNIFTLLALLTYITQSLKKKFLKDLERDLA